MVDDHDVVRIGLKNYLALEDDMEVVGEASDGAEAVAQAEQTLPDVILMDLIMERMDGITATRQIKQAHTDIQIIILTSYYDEKQVIPAMEAGAISYLLKSARADEIVQAIRAAVQGESRIESKVANQLMQSMRRPTALHAQLTEREREVLLMIAEGKTNQDIADALYIGIKTVKTHVSNILQKLEVEDRTQAAVYAHRNGLLE